ncbi:hypothetical protein BC938DRAFT_471092 [Jimgerdemannia flammicorona]|uniref:Uncharacterized protein n=1 Tax=Jimgerdemannia flammicorona TaxID=994334 RepID=A0A433QUX9_9FUNG|nr:hypothetical protein BC938DRAFT_471092 [Jimgerdemannia flammicorona]
MKLEGTISPNVGPTTGAPSFNAATTSKTSHRRHLCASLQQQQPQPSLPFLYAPVSAVPLGFRTICAGARPRLYVTFRDIRNESKIAWTPEYFIQQYGALSLTARLERRSPVRKIL